MMIRMKIGSKITLFYTCITLSLTFIILLLFYVLISRYIDTLFNMNLFDKAYLTAQKNWEKDEVDAKNYRLILQKYDKLLPQAREVLLNRNNTKVLKDSLNKYLTLSQQKQIFNGSPISFTKGELRGAALYYPDNQGNFVVLVMADNGYGLKIQQHILLLSIVLLLISSIVILFVGRIYSNNILLPLKHILQQLKLIRGNNLNIKFKGTGNKDELDDLINEINDMLDRIGEAFKSEKSFVSSASHELNNPLTAIQGECEISLMKERTPLEYIESLHRISTESLRLSQLVKQLLFLSHHDEDLLRQEKSPIDLNAFLLELSQTNERISFSNLTESKGVACLFANPYLLKVALYNFIDNACKYSKDTVDFRLKSNDGHPLIEIEDYGIGIPQEEISQIFQSFYRASNTHEFCGDGIGLALSYKILNAYNAKISIKSEENVYTKISIFFPFQ